jgi:putative transposase
VEAEALETYRDSSFAHLWRPQNRWSFEDSKTALIEAGGLADTPAGRRSYRDYLVWLSEEEGERKKLGFEQMTRGWAKGSKGFRKAVLEDLGDGTRRVVVEAEAAEVRELDWERALARGLALLSQEERALCLSAKGVPWKVALARYLRERHLVPYRWIAENLKMGAVSYVQSLVSHHRKQQGCPYWSKLQNT